MAQAPPPEAPAAEASAAAVELDDVSIRYGDERSPNGGLLAVQGVSLRIARGEFVSLVGPSGCGKSSLLRVIGGLMAPTSGRLRVLGGAARVAQDRKRLGLVFQEPALLPWRSVADNVRLPLEVNRRAERGTDPGGRVDALLRLVGLEAFRNYRPHELSGGMQQRVALARALAIDPDVLLMDEPLAALDEITREQMRYELLRIWGAASGGATPKTVVFVTHSVAEAVALSDRVLVMSRRPGRIKAAITIDLARPRSPADERSAAFLDYLDQIRGELRDEVGETQGR